MGLDWNPANKPKPGCEKEYIELFDALSGESTPDIERKKLRFCEITTSAFETLEAPRVGINIEANDWAKKKYAEKKPDMSLEQWLEKFKGYYVLELVPKCDGLPRYSSGCLGYVQLFSFRAQFLTDCTEIIGEKLLEEAYINKLVPEFKIYGQNLLAKAGEYMKKHNLKPPEKTPDNPDSVEAHIDVVLAASRWCKFWSDREHPLEAYW